jgi:hypothetical protein
VTPEMLEAQPVTAVSVKTKDEIPFGIRAIQSGIEVDGVWISRSNTPIGSSRASVIDASSQLELPQAAMLGSSRNSSRPPSSQFDRAVSAERLPNGSRSSSPGRTQYNAAPIRCSNCNHNVTHNPSAPHALESSRSAPPSGPPSGKSCIDKLNYQCLPLQHVTRLASHPPTLPRAPAGVPATNQITW